MANITKIAERTRVKINTHRFSVEMGLLRGENLISLTGLKLTSKPKHVKFLEILKEMEE